MPNQISYICALIGIVGGHVLISEMPVNDLFNQHGNEKMKLIKQLFVFSVCFFIASTAMGKENSRDLLIDFFNGPMKAEGRFTSRLDGSERQFRVKMLAKWDRHKKTLTLVEDFFFHDGEKGRKTWVFTQVGKGRYTGTREDVIGLADVWQDGEILKLRYRANIKSASGSISEVLFEDELVQISKKKVKNTASVHWWFLTVGDVELNISK